MTSIIGILIMLSPLPLSLLKTALGHPMLVELKNGETYNGHLVNCDTWMNIHLREVICTSKDGDRFWRMPECYIRGNTIKYLRVPDEDNPSLLLLFAASAISKEPLKFVVASTESVPQSLAFAELVPQSPASAESAPPFVIDKVQEETNKSRSDRKPPGVGRGRGRGREDGSNTQSKGIGRGSNDNKVSGGGGGRGRGGHGGRGGGRGRLFFVKVSKII
ncbi:hypothetical protein M5K25_000528 [Dendrobium thyrsiflorum]|uniref:U6 snRNA-associated Sm-like protein LSm4 n=1 Tax=Dendrobium thyrsiflorum TaxID=117978 RepID=A0ABD0VTU6_DENTH